MGVVNASWLMKRSAEGLNVCIHKCVWNSSAFEFNRRNFTLNVQQLLIVNAIHKIWRVNLHLNICTCFCLTLDFCILALEANCPNQKQPYVKFLIHTFTDLLYSDMKCEVVAVRGTVNWSQHLPSDRASREGEWGWWALCTQRFGPHGRGSKSLSLSEFRQHKQLSWEGVGGKPLVHFSLEWE